MTTITELRDKQIKRIMSAIRQNGPIGFTGARQAMKTNPRDARFANMTIQEFIAAGKSVFVLGR